MNQFFSWISKAFGSWKFWVIVPPWEIGVRVRLGREASALEPGPHWRIPFIDEIILVNTRLRVTTIPPVTIQTEGEEPKTIKAVIGYRINDPLVAVKNFEHPAVAMQGYAQAELSKNLPPSEVEKALEITFKGSGLLVVFVQYVENVKVPTLRLLQESWAVMSEHHKSDSLSVFERY